MDSPELSELGVKQAASVANWLAHDPGAAFVQPFDELLGASVISILEPVRGRDLPMQSIVTAARRQCHRFFAP